VVRLLIQVIPLAVAGAISPIFLLLQLTMLTTRRPLPNSLAFAAGATLPVLVVGVVTAVASHAASQHANASLGGIVDMALGGLLLVTGLRPLLAPPRSAPSPSRHRARGSRRAFTTGLVSMATDVGTLALFIAAVKLTQASSVGLINKVLVEVLAGIIILAPATIPILLEVTAPATLAPLVRTLTRLVKPRRRLVQAILGLGFGSWLIALGVIAIWTAKV
jgi:Sap, sulfolipid-1-addressing protein